MLITVPKWIKKYNIVELVQDQVFMPAKFRNKLDLFRPQIMAIIEIKKLWKLKTTECQKSHCLERERLQE